MLASSAFVLAALTMTGVYMKGQNVESRDDGYTLDFTALPNNADDKLQEITENNDEHLLKEDENIPGLTANNTAGNEIAGAPVTEDDLDYMPQEVGSGNVEIPGLTDLFGNEKDQSFKSSINTHCFSCSGAASLTLIEAIFFCLSLILRCLLLPAYHNIPASEHKPDSDEY